MSQQWLCGHHSSSVVVESSLLVEVIRTAHLHSTEYPTTVVKSRSLSQSAILDGVRDAKVYIVEGPGMTIDMKVTGQNGWSL